MPLETMTPQRSASASSSVKPAEAIASWAETRASWVKRPIRLASGLPM